MKPAPTTPEEVFAKAKAILGGSGYKLYTPNGKYYRQKLQCIAATSYQTKKLCLLQLRSTGFIVHFLPPWYGDRKMVADLEALLGVTVKTGRPLARLTIDDPWDASEFYVTPKEREAFAFYVKHANAARLS